MSDNPPTFPSTGEGFGNPAYSTPGMTLRDWFAGQALVSALEGATNLDKATKEQRGEAFSLLAEYIYELADAMLTERAK